jgi:hypothetical protein
VGPGALRAAGAATCAHCTRSAAAAVRRAGGSGTRRRSSDGGAVAVAGTSAVAAARGRCASGGPRPRQGARQLRLTGAVGGAASIGWLAAAVHGPPGATSVASLRGWVGDGAGALPAPLPPPQLLLAPCITRRNGAAVSALPLRCCAPARSGYAALASPRYSVFTGNPIAVVCNLKIRDKLFAQPPRVSSVRGRGFKITGCVPPPPLHSPLPLTLHF